MRVYGVGRVTEFALGPPRIQLRRRTTQYYSRSLGVGTLTIYDADMASQQSTSYGACVGSTLVRNSHSITQEWREECTGGLFFRFRYFFWCWRCVWLWLGGVTAQVWMTIMQLNDVSIRSHYPFIRRCTNVKCTVNVPSLLQWLVVIIGQNDNQLLLL